jgi:hypothetical protein
MRRLDFDPGDADRRYMLLYWCLCNSPAELARNEVRPHGELLSKLEGIGQIANPGRPQMAPAEYRCIGGGNVMVTEIEFTLAKRFASRGLEIVSRTWSREMDRLLTWLDYIPEVQESVKSPEAAPG